MALESNSRLIAEMLPTAVLKTSLTSARKEKSMNTMGAKKRVQPGPGRPGIVKDNRAGAFPMEKESTSARCISASGSGGGRERERGKLVVYTGQVSARRVWVEISNCLGARRSEQHMVCLRDTSNSLCVS